MKKTITLLLLLVSTLTFAQIQKLGELSSGKFIDSKIIYEDHTDDVFGYFLLYENDRKSKEVYELEYVVLDKNLNKITSNTFTQGVYKSFLSKTNAILSFVKKNDNEIIIGLQDKVTETGFHINNRYRRINLTDFNLSEEFIVNDFKPKDKIYKEGDVIYIEDFMNNQALISTKGNYFISFAIPEHNPRFSVGYESDKKRKSIKSFSVLDAQLNTVWNRELNTGKDKFYYDYFNSDQTVFLLNSRHYKSIVINAIEIFDFKKGFIAEFPITDPKYNLFIDEAKFNNDEIILYARLFEKKDKELTNKKTLGYSKIILDKKTGKEIRRDYLLWNDLHPHILTKGKYGEIPKYGKIYVQDFIHLENGNTIFIAEGFITKKNSEILDLFVFELDSNLKVTYFKKTDKNKRTLKDLKASGGFLKQIGAFDFLYSQKLDNDGNYVFFYVNNEKEGSRKAKRKNPEWVLGIVTYVDGEFNYDKLQLTQKDSQIIPGKAKNGYIRLLEIEDKEIELRLEKINY